MPLLSVKDLNIDFSRKKVIKGISYDINENEILGVVGESGSGKSVSSLALMGLLPRSMAKIRSGSIHFNTCLLYTSPSPRDS